MTAKAYEIVEKNKDVQYGILSELVETPTKGVAYMFMMQGEIMSASDITDFLMLSSSHHIQQFNDAVVELEVNGLIREAEGDPADDTGCTTGVACVEEAA
jgi:hypothetical protein